MAGIRSEALGYHGPGWRVESDRFEVMCWAPGEIVHRGGPDTGACRTGEFRTGWSLSVDTGLVVDGSDEDGNELGSWTVGDFAKASSLEEVLPALDMLSAADASVVRSVLTEQLGGF